MNSETRQEQGTMNSRAEYSSDDNDSLSAASPNGHDDSGSITDSVYTSHRGSGNRRQQTGRDSASSHMHVSARWLRSLVVAFLISMTVLAPIEIYRIASENESDSFHGYFDSLATKVVRAFEFNIARKLDAIDSLAVTITSHALRTSSVQPLVTLPDFDLLASNSLALADSFALFLVPMVSQSMRETWEEYSIENQGWINATLTRQPVNGSISSGIPQKLERQRRLQGPEDDDPTEIYPYIHTYNDDILQVPSDSSSRYYFPIWQMSPLDIGLVNLDILSVESFSNGLETMVSTRQAVLGELMDLSSTTARPLRGYYGRLLMSISDNIDERNEDEHDEGPNTNGTTTGPRESLLEPVSTLFYPLFSKFDPTHRDRLVSGLLMSVIWKTNLERIIPSDVRSVYCVIENTCNETFTYLLDGTDVVYLGSSDYHDTAYDKFAHTLDINIAAQNASRISLDQTYCPYKLTVYPSQALEDSKTTARPAAFAALTALALVLISCVAITYDYVVQQRLKAVLDSAVESKAIISSLFPEKFRDRLFEQNGEEAAADKTFGEASGVDQGTSALQPAKMRLKSFINEAPKANNSDIAVLKSKPIADLFPHCTVLFADIAGFTAWSSEREPAQVFTLLQTIFHHFDQIARKWGVFKIETIGDCYVAVTGLPDPQADHAVRMAKFSRECLRTVVGLTHQLETTLGPDTGDLSMRFGLNSGPVTAGVLRGEKSRFQLFGDTVNTASRMENTGLKDNIQVSQATADLLIEAGKSNWLTARDELVSIKGKGQLQTYWVKVQRRDSNDAYQKARAMSADGNAEVVPVEPARRASMIPQSIGGATQDRKLRRLIDWQTEILARLLQQIIAQRDRKSAAKFVADPVSVLEKKSCVLDEVAEILVLPKFEEMEKNIVDPKSIEISPVVLSQLREYVGIIANKYHGNPFHNFEHASHVTMSASKLLSRIVVPESVNYDQENRKDIAKDQHDYTYGITSDPLTQFAAIFCSLIHDVDHQGVSNFQLGTERPDMAKHYKDRSLAEQNSVDIAWDLLMQPEFRNLQQTIFATEADLKRFRQLIVNLVLATDIFDKDFKALRDSRWNRAFHQTSTNEEEQFNLKSTIVIEHIIQAADVAHTMQHWHVYTKWNERLFQEMYLAYENGRMAKDPSEGWYKGELWFFDNYVIPLGKKLDECNVFGVASDEGLNYALQNRNEWALKGDQMVKDMLQRYKDSKEFRGTGHSAGGRGSMSDEGTKVSIDDSAE